VWPVAIYWISLDIGTPPKSFPVAIDSGSMTLDIQGPGCANCPKFAPNNVYQPTASSTSKPCSLLTCHLPKTFSNTYQTCDLADPDAPCTIKGQNFRDMVSLGSLGPVPVTFGAITYQTSNFDQFKQIDGVVGLAGAAGSGNVFESLRSAGYIEEDMFGMCLAQVCPAATIPSATILSVAPPKRLFSPTRTVHSGHQEQWHLHCRCAG
jgi:hypothetical protein